MATIELRDLLLLNLCGGIIVPDPSRLPSAIFGSTNSFFSIAYSRWVGAGQSPLVKGQALGVQGPGPGCMSILASHTKYCRPCPGPRPPSLSDPGTTAGRPLTVGPAHRSSVLVVCFFPCPSCYCLPAPHATASCYCLPAPHATASCYACLPVHSGPPLP